MITVYRYPLAITDVQTIEAPGLIEFLSVDGSRSDYRMNADVEMWALVNTSMPMRHYEVRIVGTGNPFPPQIGSDWLHLGHALTHNGAYVWHVWANPTPLTPRRDHS